MTYPNDPHQPQPGSTPEHDDKMARRRSLNKKILIGTGIALAVLLVFAVVGALGSDDTDDAATQETTSSAAPATSAAETTTAAPAPTTTSVAATTPPAAPAPAPRVADARCAPADATVVDLIQAGLNEPGYTLTNATAIVDGELTFVGATTLDASGEMDNRSDVWIIEGGAPYSSTGGARNGSVWPSASSMLNVSPGDERVAAVDGCVVALTTGR